MYGRRLWDSGFEEAADAGGYPDRRRIFGRISKAAWLCHLTREQWLAARREAMTANADVLNIARAIKQDADLAIYTNNGPLVKDHLDVLLPEAAAIFERRFCSYEFGTKKPDPQSFTRLVNSLDRKPEECWFIDDKKSNVEGARIAGLLGHHFRHAEILADEARALGFNL